MADDTPKIIVDSDWKAQAQAEKERLAAKEAASKPVSKAPAGSGAGSSGSSPGDGATRAPADQEEGEITLFEELLRMLASQALLYMGAFPDPSTGQAVLSPEMAKLHIDMLGMIEEKTKGNLSETESQVIRSYLHELRMQYIEISRAVAKAIQEGRLKPQSSGGVAMPGSSGGVVGPGPLG